MPQDFYRAMEDDFMGRCFLPAFPRLTDGVLLSYGFKKGTDASSAEAMELELGTILTPGEEWIESADYNARVVGLENLAGAQHALWWTIYQHHHRKYGEYEEAVVDFLHFRGSYVLSLENGARYFASIRTAEPLWKVEWKPVDTTGFSRFNRLIRLVDKGYS